MYVLMYIHIQIQIYMHAYTLKRKQKQTHKKLETNKNNQIRKFVSFFVHFIQKVSILHKSLIIAEKINEDQSMLQHPNPPLSECTPKT